MKYLLIKSADSDGYWDTSGHCHWHRKEHYEEIKFDLDEEEAIINSIGRFMSEYPNGEVSLYKIEDIEYDTKEYDHLQDIISYGKNRSKLITAEKEKKKKQKEAEEIAISKKREEERELAQLKKLQEKYSANK